MTPTSAQTRTLKLIEQFVSQHGYPPTTRELATLRGSRRSAVQRSLEHLKAKGYVTWEPRTVGTLRILKPLEEP